MSSLTRGLARLGASTRASPRNAVTVDTLGLPNPGLPWVGESSAMKLSAVSRCVDILSDSMSKLPNYMINTRTRERVTGHPVMRLLNIRPNEAMTPSVRKKLLEGYRNTAGNSYDWIYRNRATGRPWELIPVPSQFVQPWRDQNGHVWYTVYHPLTGAPMKLSGADIMHYKAYSRDGLTGISVLERASEVISAGRAAQSYDLAYYTNGGYPSGTLTTESDLQGDVTYTDADGIVKTSSKKARLREQWEQMTAGPSNAHRVAVLDFGLKYAPLAINNKDAQFVENKEVSVKDIARFFGVPLYKLQEGKQAYGSNEQNAIEYVTSTLHPIVTQYEEEQTWKLLTDSELSAGLELRINMMAELKGDVSSRGTWYKNMRETGGFSVNDILALEDMPDVAGGDERYASLNYVPLSLWKDLSIMRNGGSSNASNP